MKSMEAIYLHAVLADVAYIDIYEIFENSKVANTVSWGDIPTDSGAVSDFKQRGLTEQQFDDFRSRYSIIDHISNDTFGLSATLFRDKFTGQPVITYRGTETSPVSQALLDGLLQDVFGVFLGMSHLLGQGVNSANAFQGWIDAGYISTDEPATVVGHSLGGHLSLMALAEYGAYVSDVYTYNGAGINGLDYLLDEPSLDSSKVTRVYSDVGYEVTANDVLLQQFGEAHIVKTNPQSLASGLGTFLADLSIGNHSMVHLVDSLSLARAFATADPELSLEQLNKIISGAANRRIETIIHSKDTPATNGLPETDPMDEAAISHTTVLQHLARQLGFPSSANLTLNEIKPFVQYLNAQVDSGASFTIIGMDNIDNALTLATEDIGNWGRAIRYALMNDVSFVVVPLSDFNGGIFGAADDVDLSDYSRAFWSDRLDFHLRFLASNEQNLHDHFGQVSGAGSKHYFDYLNQDHLDVNGQPYGPTHIRGEQSASDHNDAFQLNRFVVFGEDLASTGDTLDGGLNILGDHLYGLKGDDVLRGHAGADVLDGGQGDDTLDGGDTNDWLLGGKGDDRYEFGLGDDRDIVRDTQGDNTVYFDDNQVTHLVPMGDGSSLYRNTDNNDSRIYVHTSSGLVVTTPDSVDTVLLENWDPEQNSFGIQLAEQADSHDMEDFFFSGQGTDNHHVIDLLRMSDDPHLTKLFVEEFYPSPTYPDQFTSRELYKSDAFDTHVPIFFSTGLGDDVLFGLQAGDVLTGGAGGDFIVGDSNRYPERLGDIRDQPGAGEDLLQGGAGDDLIYGEYGQDQILGGADNDLIDGGQGNDQVDGGGGHDLLSGSQGQDTVSGGAGNDVIWGDRGIYSTGADEALDFWHTLDKSQFWQINFSLDAEGYLNAPELQGVGVYQLFDDQDNQDTLLGGAGQDYLNGEGDNDALFGGEGEDRLVGHQGDDYLHGGTDNDILFGDDEEKLHAGQDDLYGGEGHDRLFGGGGTDFLFGGKGDDLLDGESGSDYLFGDDGADILNGGDAVDFLTGGFGDDTLSGGAGEDVFYFNLGDGHDTVVDSVDDMRGDTWVFGAGIDFDDLNFIDLGSGTLIEIGTQASLSFDHEADHSVRWEFSTVSYQFGSVEADDIQTNDQSEKVFLYEGDDVLSTFGGQDLVFGGLGNDTAYLGDGDDTYYGEDGNDWGFGEGGNDTLYGGSGENALDGGAGEDTLHGGADVDFLYGGEGNDTLFGGAGNDQLYGNAGNDVLSGGEGNNAYYFGLGDGDDVIETRQMSALESGQSVIGIGTSLGANDLLFTLDQEDLIITIKSSGETLTVKNFYRSFDTGNLAFGEIAGIVFMADSTSLNAPDIHQKVLDDYALSDAAGPGGELIFGSPAGGRIRVYSGFNTIYSLGARDRVTAGSGNDHIYGNAGNDYIDGYRGDDHIDGGPGNDALYGGDGADFIIGGQGNDTLVDDRSNDIYWFDIGDGQDRYITKSNHNEQDEVHFGAGVLASSLTFERDALDLVVNYGFGNDQIRFVDWYVSQTKNVSRFVFENGASFSASEIDSRVSHVLEGDAQNNELSGGYMAETFYGHEGNDEIDGGRGDDLLFGGSGDDILKGGDGDDELYGGDGDDELEAGQGSVRLEGGHGNDRITRSGEDQIYYALGDGHDVILGGGGHFYLGKDLSPDQFDVRKDAYDLILAHQNGSDSLRFDQWMASSSNTFDMIQFENGEVLTPDELTATLTDIRGTASSETLVGTYLADEIYGADGDDDISAGAGDDLIFGGGGDDTIYGSNGSNTIYGGAGNDLIHQAFIAFGGDGDDEISGAELENVQLTGGAGNDYLKGNGSSDSFYFFAGDGHDRIYASGGGRLVFGPTLSPDNMIFSQDGHDLLITHTSGNDSVRISRWFLFSYRRLATIEFDNGVHFGADAFDDAFLIKTGTPGDDELLGASQDEEFYGLAGNDLIRGSFGDDLIDGGDDNDILIGEDGIDSLYGGEGDDQLFGGEHNGYRSTFYDEFHGGAGDDLMHGQAGVYYFNRGDGNDMIQDFKANISMPQHQGIVRFGETITAQDLSWQRDENDLLISVSDSDSVRIVEWFVDARFLLGRFEFTDGSVLSTDDVSDFFRTLTGTEANDHLVGSFQDEFFYGLAGNDRIYGWDGDDEVYGGAGDDYIELRSGTNLIEGGPGNDTLVGGSQNDLYMYAPGDGSDLIMERGVSALFSDTLRFAQGIHLAEVDFGIEGPDLVIELLAEEQQIRVDEWFLRDDRKLEHLEFYSGEVLGIEDVNARISLPATEGDDDLALFKGLQTVDALAGDDAIEGSSYDDVIQGGAGQDRILDLDDDGDDEISGGTGDDWIELGGGNNRIKYGLGEGHDVVKIHHNASINVLEFGAGIAPDSIVLSYQSGDLVLGLSDGSGSIRIVEAFSNDEYLFGIDQLVFASANGPQTFSLEAFSQLTDDSNNLVIGNASSESIQANAGDDTVFASGGDDTIEGGTGDDLLVGSAGNDIITGGKGADVMPNGSGNNRYLFELGDGLDRIIQLDTADAASTIAISNMAQASDLQFKRTGKDLQIRYSGSDAIVWEGYFNLAEDEFDWRGARIVNQRSMDSNVLHVIETDFGEVDHQMIVNQLFHIDAGDDYYVGDSENNVIDGLGGDDTLLGYNGDDALYGSDGNDALYGEHGNDFLVGGKGDDQIFAGYGDDIVYLERGDGVDEIDFGLGLNVLRFGPGVTPDDIVLEQRYVFSQLYSDVPGFKPEITLSYGSTDAAKISSLHYSRVPGYEFIGSDGELFSVDTRTNKLTVYGVDAQAEDLSYIYNVTGRGSADSGSSTHFSDVIYGGTANERIRGVMGQNEIYGGAGDDIIYGGLHASYLNGGLGDDSLQGSSDPTFSSTLDAGNVLEGGQGNDRLFSGAGFDTYLFEQGDGIDTINDRGGDNSVLREFADKIEFGHNVAIDSVSFDFDGDDLIVHYGESDQITIGNYFAYDEHLDWWSNTGTIEDFLFANGSAYDSIDLFRLRNSGNITPVVLNALDDQLIEGVGEFWSWQLPDETFYDLNGDTLTYQIARKPDWLDLDERTLSARPDNLQVGSHQITVVASDGRESISSTFNLTVRNENNQAPVVPASALDLALNEDQFFDWTAPESLFFDPDGDELYYSVERSGDSALPDWLNFDGQTLSGQPDNDDVGAIELLVTASDGLLSSSALLNLTVSNTNDAPVLAGVAEDHYIAAEQLSVFSFADELFLDVDANDSLTWSARMLSGAELPEWLVFDAPTHTFSVQANTAPVGEFDIELMVNDLSDASAQTSFSLLVGDATDPVINLTGNKKPETLEGASNHDVLNGKGGADTLLGYAGNDSLIGAGGHDRLFGHEGNDVLKGGNGDDVLIGGSGDDLLIGGKGNDVYRFETGDGSDVIANASKNFNAEVDVIEFDNSVAAADLWFDQVNKHLDIYVLGSDDKVRIKNWYRDDKFQVDRIDLNGPSIDTSGIESLVSAMAAFGAPQGGEMVLSAEDQTQIDSAIAANWQSA